MLGEPLEAPVVGQPQEPSFSEPLEADGGTAPQETQAPVAEEAPQEGQEAPQKEGQPLIAGKFKSYEDLAKSYQELEREFTRTSQELARLQAQYEMLWKQIGAPEQQTGEQGGAQTQQDESAFLSEFLSSPQRALEKIIQRYTLPVQETISKLLAEQLTNHWAQREAYYREKLGSAFDAVRQRVHDYFRRNPQLMRHKDGYDEAVKMAIGELALEGKLAPPQPPRVEAPKAPSAQSFDREVYEFARALGKKPEEAYRILKAIEEGKPVSMESLEPEEV